MFPSSSSHIYLTHTHRHKHGRIRSMFCPDQEVRRHPFRFVIVVVVVVVVGGGGGGVLADVSVKISAVWLLLDPLGDVWCVR